MLCSCSAKKITYFKDIDTMHQSASNSANEYEAVIKKDDLLAIVVSCSDPTAALPFNLPTVAYQSSSGQLSSAQSLQGYLVNSTGNIDFPVIGTIHVAGKTRQQLVDQLKKELTTYMHDPIVSVKYLNYKITVLGEVAKPGSFTIPNERITLLEALGLAGDMTVYGKRNNVLVIREINNKQLHHRVNMNSNDLFSSPVYYLQQNDVVYVEPNKAKATGGDYSSFMPLFVSLGSLFTTIAALLIR
ncbi:MAG: polysaccharide biosynthesis/export family protein, partial [Tannerellaceae bacterium]